MCVCVPGDQQNSQTENYAVLQRCSLDAKSLQLGAFFYQILILILIIIVINLIGVFLTISHQYLTMEYCRTKIILYDFKAL